MHSHTKSTHISLGEYGVHMLSAALEVHRYTHIKGHITTHLTNVHNTHKHMLSTHVLSQGPMSGEKSPHVGMGSMGQVTLDKSPSSL